MKRWFTLLMLWVTPFVAFVCSSAIAQPSAYQLPRTQVVPLNDPGTAGQYELLIKLPEDYQDGAKRYPVLYYTDAAWHIEMLASAATFLMEEVILVGISWQKDLPKKTLLELGEQASRYRDYSIKPSTNKERQAKYQYGQAAQHLNFIRQQVIPYVEDHYRTIPEHRGYFGYSMGGGFGAYVLMKHPDTFKHYMLGSPSIWKNTDFLLQQAASTPKQANVFISFGSEESRLGRYVLEFISRLQSEKSDSISVTFKVIDGDHGTAAPFTGAHAVQWLSKMVEQEAVNDK